jgi:hypothetical protein
MGSEHVLDWIATFLLQSYHGAHMWPSAAGIDALGDADWFTGKACHFGALLSSGFLF